MDQFNWGVHRHSLSSLNAEGEKDNITQATPTSSRKVHPLHSSILISLPKTGQICCEHVEKLDLLEYILVLFVVFCFGFY